MTSRLTAAPQAVKIGYTCARFGSGTRRVKLDPSRMLNPSPTPATPTPTPIPTTQQLRQPPNQGEDERDDEVAGTENGNLV